MPNHDIIVLGASAGGVEALSAVVAGLPHDLPAAVFVVLHLPPAAPSVLANILQRAGSLPASSARDGEPILPGRIYVAPPDRHLLLMEAGVRLVRGPHENRHRPAVDPLFRTAARFWGTRVIGAVLTGALNDGTSGLFAIKQRGGITIAQDPATAMFPSMPASACAYVAVDYCLPLPEIAAVLTRLAHTPAPDQGAFPMSDDLIQETNILGLDPTASERDAIPGTITSLSCPECSGPIWETRDGELRRYRCRVGHAFTADTMEEGLADAVEDALWIALNMLDENASVLERMVEDARQRQHVHLAQRLQDKIADRRHNAQVIRRVLFHDPEPLGADGTESASDRWGTNQAAR